MGGEFTGLNQGWKVMQLLSEVGPELTSLTLARRLGGDHADVMVALELCVTAGFVDSRLKQILWLTLRVYKLTEAGQGAVQSWSK